MPESSTTKLPVGTQGLIPLHPAPPARHACPHDGTALSVVGWYLPGMRMLAELKCSQCSRNFYGDLPAGHGLLYPMLLDQATGEVSSAVGANWFAERLAKSYRCRSNETLNLSVERVRQPRIPVLLNCLDSIYGHCLLKLLNAQYHLDHHKELDLVVLVPRCLRWLVPDGVSEIWTVDAPLAKCSAWSDWLARQLAAKLQEFPEVYLSPALPQPNFAIDIKRFSRIQPFAFDDWADELDAPAITFIFREDRTWSSMQRHLTRRLWGFASAGLRGENRVISAFATALRKRCAEIDFAVTGIAPRGGLPGWIRDLRAAEVSEPLERQWCERYARSHFVIGIHGSNMLLPSAHAGASIILMPPDRWGNLAQDVVQANPQPADQFLRTQFVPASVTTAELAALSLALLHNLPLTRLSFTSHDSPLLRHPESLAASYFELAHKIRGKGSGRP